MKKFTILLIVVFIAIISFCNAKEYEASVGISALINKSHMDISFPFLLSGNFMLAPDFLISYAQNVVTNIGIGATARIYTIKREAGIAGKVLPYFSLQAAALITSPKTGDSYTDLLFGGAFGGEYFISDHFSVGVEAQLNCVKSDTKSTTFGNPGNLNINTATGAFITIYFWNLFKLYFLKFLNKKN